MSQFYCQFWCKPHKIASVTCVECGDFVFDNVAFLCKLCSERQHLKHADHELRSIEDYITMSKSQTKSAMEDSKVTVCKSVLLVDDCEALCIKDMKALGESLGMSDDMPVNVLSIFGNTGDGKSHTLNHIFFGGHEVFATSSNQKPGTIGMWVAYDPDSNTLVIDTEGLLGISSNLNRRTRLLLKILALSDVALYRTRAERLHNDMFVFLSDASSVYCQHFSSELKTVMEKHNIDVPVSQLGPKVLVVHETQFTDTLDHYIDTVTEQVLTDDEKSGTSKRLVSHQAEEEITARFLALGDYPKAFSKIRYIGIKSGKQPTDFDTIRDAVLEELGSNSIRNRKSLSVIMETLQVLNSKFSNTISAQPLATFSNEFFRCPTLCLTCGDQCKLSVSHEGKHAPSTTYCRYQHLHKNRVYICGQCYQNGVRSEVTSKSFEDSDSVLSGYVKMAWSGYVIECDKCGVIYRSRQYWYGNKPPELESVRTEIVHVWPGEEGRPENIGRYVLDQIYSVSETIGQYSAGPTQVLTDWINDQIAPPYWVPNHFITMCSACKKEFVPLAQKHHCRACGNGFCCDCSMKSKPVPWRGWGYEPVRVCDKCFASTDEELTEEYLLPDMTAWKVSECIKTAASVVKSVVEVPASIVTDSVRPEYWVPDVDIIECFQCKAPVLQDKHHCRSCGQGFCSGCTEARKAVPERGWTYPVRVCDTCSLTL